VLDGLERVQEDAGSGRVRGELSDQTLKLLLRALAAGLGRARALVTSRFPLVDLQDWTNRGYRDTRLDDLSPEAAAAVLRGWEVVGDEAALGAAAAQVGYHALSVAVIGSYLRSFAHGHIEEVKRFDLDAVTGDDPKAAKLARGPSARWMTDGRSHSASARRRQSGSGTRPTWRSHAGVWPTPARSPKLR
jgi:hypothetical protein